MIIHPDGEAVFLEVPKNGSTAVSVWLRRQHGWIQNGNDMTVPDTQQGRHGWLEPHVFEQLRDAGVTIYGICRNPWDRAASLWRGHAPKNQSFDRWLETGRFMHGKIDVKNTGQHFWLKHATDVLRYEHLEAEWRWAHERHPHILPAWPEGGIPRENVSKSRAKPEWTQAQRDWVTGRWGQDINFGGYSGPT